MTIPMWIQKMLTKPDKMMLYSPSIALSLSDQRMEVRTKEQY